ncbi:sulfotransferase 1E1-like [Glandiceps talaboti]
MVDAETIANSGCQLDVDNIRNFEVRPDDIFVLTYAKSGTTWCREILPLILNQGDTEAIKGVPQDLKAPYIDFAASFDIYPPFRESAIQNGVPEDFDINTLNSPRVIISHLREEFLPKEIKSKNPKIIYIARNPKDVAVSCFHMVQKGLPANNMKPYDSFSSFLIDFAEAKHGMQYAIYDGTAWRNHVIPWWNKRHEPNVFFTTFEDMKKDLECVIRQMAVFLEIHLEDDIVRKIADYCSFDSMKKNPEALRSEYCSKILNVDPHTSSPFVRKGMVGGWKEYFTVAENEAFDYHYQEWTKNTDLIMTFEL